jgi:hypothetical protein
MRKSTCLLLAGAVAIAVSGCDQDGGSGDAANASANVAAAAPKKVPYCFYKDENTKGWTASVGKDGNVTVKGKALVADGRYRAELKPPEISGTTATVQLGMPQNDTGFSTENGWWDVKSEIPNSGAVTQVEVLCGAKTVANLTVKR